MITLNVNGTELDFEHSLVSLSEWEAEFEKLFYSPTGDNRTSEELFRYFELMFVGPKDQRHLVQILSDEQQLLLVQYITKARTATKIREIKSRGPKENISSELIYYWLVAFGIPFKPTDEWHLNRLLTLVKVCSAKQAPPQKSRQSKAQMAMSMREINEQRRKQLGTTG